MGASNLQRFRLAVDSALEHLEARRQEINDLNVFPVADGDTGENMALTLRAVRDELDRLQGQDPETTIDQIGRKQIVESVAHAALMGARGNSGVILSQLIRGAAEKLATEPGELIDVTRIGEALTNGAQRAYDSVREPAEGTILTVAREIAAKVVSDAHRGGNQPLDSATDPAEQNEIIAEALERALDVGRDSVRRGRELLPVLREAGVVDAGGYGLLVVLAGFVAALRDGQAPPLEHHEAPVAFARSAHRSSTYRFCTNFAVTGRGLHPAAFTPLLEELGDSVLVVGDESTVRVHVHTDHPDRARALFAGRGDISHEDIADMHEQMADRDHRLGENAGERVNGAIRTRTARCGALAVVNGEGLRELFAELGVRTIDGGPTLNPSTHDLLAGIHDVPAEELVLLPNSANVIMAAEHAAKLSEKDVWVAPTTSQQAGLAAAVALAHERSLEENRQALEEALARVRTGAVAPAARDDALGRFKRGEAVGFVGDEVLAWGDPRATLEAVVHELAEGENGHGPPELISVLDGQHAPLGLSELEGIVNGGVEVELRHGGQPAYWWLLAAE